ncbi:hypothetical protein CGCA056_v012108 [Colletotrichum aenigma]|uniref:uncharacterized protein n=1 Tax=Colletotrichum aenigma TaxID=1215731 RepID=UPI001872CEAF|nr:uncharacterized protein CGCA056_v012108 [Colletotrichum aenigma]KAF5512752.1 hypothetical protein CGCA056_v012108 [Colletotrichum aenigma]
MLSDSSGCRWDDAEFVVVRKGQGPRREAELPDKRRWRMQPNHPEGSARTPLFQTSEGRRMIRRVRRAPGSVKATSVCLELSTVKTENEPSIVSLDYLLKATQ